MTASPTSVKDDFNDLAGHIGDILSDPNISLTDAQTTRLQNDSEKLTDAANKLADGDALAALGAAQQDIDRIKAATGDANDALGRLKANAQRLNTILTIVGDAVSLGAAIATGPLTGVLSAATTLATDSSQP